VQVDTARTFGTMETPFPMRLHPEEEVTKLRSIILRKSVKFGQFRLASGVTSDVYVDCKATTCSAEAMPLIGRIFLQRIKEEGWRPEAVGGLTVGAEPIAFAVARESLETDRLVDSFIVRKEPKEHGTQKLVEGFDGDMTGKQVVIIDDVCSKGGSTALAIKNARSVGMHVIGAICLVDREMGAEDLLVRECGCKLVSIFKLSALRPKSNDSGVPSEPVSSAA
jgi:orotate phosphoribosyltransferase